MHPDFPANKNDTHEKSHLPKGQMAKFLFNYLFMLMTVSSISSLTVTIFELDWKPR